mmetsp:Transcript_8939/g.19097  ORF Transcript_8939/g.19097 Transcript_8939/m.19097 type:complete len:826 (+) Transcript_8939:241-2718(+)
MRGLICVLAAVVVWASLLGGHAHRHLEGVRSPALRGGDPHKHQPRTLPSTLAHSHLHPSHEGGCGHSKISHLQDESVREFTEYLASQKASGQQHQGSAHKRKLGSGDGETIRIRVDYQTVYSLTGAQQQAVSKMVDIAVRIIQKFVKVKVPLTGPLMVRSSVACAPGTIPAYLRAGSRGEPNVDFYLMVTAQNSASCGTASAASTASQSGTVAWAMACDYSLDPASQGRPLLGVLNLCTAAVTAAVAAAQGTGSSVVTDVFVHEVLHALGLSSSMYSTWLDSYGRTLGSYAVYSIGSSPYLVTSKASEEAKRLLGCNQLPGAPLEGQGGTRVAQSHWEYRFFHQEVLTPYFINMTSNQRQRLSGLTLGALEDTGWYSTRWSYVQPLDLSLLPRSTLGCDLALSSCQDYQAKNPGTYYCSTGSTTQNRLQCYGPRTPAVCDPSPFGDGCGIIRAAPTSCTEDISGRYTADKNLFKTIPNAPSNAFYLGLGACFGSDSMCVPWYSSSQRAGGCFNARCDAYNTPYVTAVKGTGLVSIPCPAGSTVLLSTYLPVKDTSTTLECPSLEQALAFCRSASGAGSCPYGCQHGICQDGTCSCDLEYMGADCSIHVSDVTDFNKPGSSGGGNNPGPNPSQGPSQSPGQNPNPVDNSPPSVYVYASPPPPPPPVSPPPRQAPRAQPPRAGPNNSPKPGPKAGATTTTTTAAAPPTPSVAPLTTFTSMGPTGSPFSTVRRSNSSSTGSTQTAGLVAEPGTGGSGSGGTQQTADAQEGVGAGPGASATGELDGGGAAVGGDEGSSGTDGSTEESDSGGGLIDMISALLRRNRKRIS